MSSLFIIISTSFKLIKKNIYKKLKTNEIIAIYIIKSKKLITFNYDKKQKFMKIYRNKKLLL